MCRIKMRFSAVNSLHNLNIETWYKKVYLVYIRNYSTLEGVTRALQNRNSGLGC